MSLEIPEAFANAFIAIANDMNDHEDELDLGLSDNHTRLYLSSGCPGFSPYLRLAATGADVVAVEICCDDNRRLEDGTWELTRGEIQAVTAVDLADPVAAARRALECWWTTL